MEGFGRIVAITIMVFLSVVASSAAATVENDGGSGGDAGGNWVSAIAVAPGTFFGTFHPGEDFDAYNIHVPYGYGIFAAGTAPPGDASQSVCVAILDRAGQGGATWTGASNCVTGDNWDWAPFGRFGAAGPTSTGELTIVLQKRGPSADPWVGYSMSVELVPLPDFVAAISEEAAVATAPSARTFVLSVQNIGLGGGDFRAIVADASKRTSDENIINGGGNRLTDVGESDVSESMGQTQTCSGHLNAGGTARFIVRTTAVGSSTLKANLTSINEHILRAPGLAVYESDATNNVALHYSPGPVELPTGLIVPTSCVAE